MAETDETFDPNDLDSIDALLDEAESDTAVEGIESEGDVESSDADQDSLDELLEEAEDISEPDNETESEDNSEKEAAGFPDASLAQDEDDKRQLKAGKDSKGEAVHDTDDFLARRATAQSNNNSNMAAKDMDAIKKQIMIFGAATIALVLIGIGIGVWSVLAAKGSAMDEETFTIIESNLVRSELNGKGIAESGNLLKSLDKKLDALSFQLEGLVADIAKIEEQSQQQVSSVMPGVINVGHKPAGGDDAKEGAKEAVKTAAVGHTQTAPVQMSYAAADPRLLDKVTSVNSKVIKAQRRIDEVNRRVKGIQQQYKTLLHSVKTVEKQLVMQQVAMEEKEKEKKAKKNQYQYETPDGMFYYQSVGDSYP